jgi:hypothetical protein
MQVVRRGYRHNCDAVGLSWSPYEHDPGFIATAQPPLTAVKPEVGADMRNSRRGERSWVAVWFHGAASSQGAPHILRPPGRRPLSQGPFGAE